MNHINFNELRYPVAASFNIVNLRDHSWIEVYSIRYSNNAQNVEAFANLHVKTKGGLQLAHPANFPCPKRRFLLISCLIPACPFPSEVLLRFSLGAKHVWAFTSLGG